MAAQAVPSSKYPSSTSPSTVSWQTAFWTLIPLATNMITQPSGRVLSLNIRHRTYLRSSPILCALDAICFVIRLIFLPILLRTWPCRAFEIVVQERYKKSEGAGEDEESGEEEAEGGIQSLEKQTWLRWVFFLVGALGPAIKLAAMQGVPWTKTWGMIFLCSFIIFETMGFTFRKDGYTAVAQESPLERRAQRHLDNFSVMDRTIFNIGIVLHTVLLLFAIISIWSLRGRHYHDVYTRPYDASTPPELEWPASLMPPVAALAALVFVLNGLLTLSLFCVAWFSIRDATWGTDTTSISREKWQTRAGVIGFWLFLPFGCLFMTVVGAISFAPTAYIIDLPILVVVVGTAPLMMVVFSWLCGKLPGLGKTLLLRPAGRVRKWKWFRLTLDFEDLSNLMFFLINLAICTAWYSLKYSPEGTVNPGWTGVFG